MSGIRLHIGGKIHNGSWRILNIQPGPNVDYVGSCVDLSFLEAGSVSEIYASHVLEHLSYRLELPLALREFYRVLQPGGALSLSVPDLDILVDIYRDPAATPNEQWLAISMLFGGHSDAHDVHKTGFSFKYIHQWLADAGFFEIQRVTDFNYFKDSSATVLMGRKISLNISARKPEFA
jgi:predicted SAM-dependent methyltransferase